LLSFCLVRLISINLREWKGREEIGWVYLSSQLERTCNNATLQLCTWW
jgi:hypothetical protein